MLYIGYQCVDLGLFVSNLPLTPGSQIQWFLFIFCGLCCELCFMVLCCGIVFCFVLDGKGRGIREQDQARSLAPPVKPVNNQPIIYMLAYSN